jgi:hypothetical protein
MQWICEPRYATRRRPERETYGPRLGKIASKLGTPLMPWQQLVADVGLELVWHELPNGKRVLLPAYREVIVTIPRQNGKTTLVLTWEMDRAISWGSAQRIAYTAQTGNDARKKLLEDQVPLIQQSALDASIAPNGIRRVNGSEGIRFRNGSKLDVLASSVAAGHGRTLDLGVIDEAFEDVDDRREQAMLPAMVTRPDAQLLVVSTMGTDASTYLNRKVDAGRDMVLSDRDDAEIAYFEWSADQESDIDDPETWRSCMPAFGITISERVIRHARDTMTEGEFRRAFLNQRTAAEERVIPLDAWNAACGSDVTPDRELVFAIDCNPERTFSSIAVADLDGLCELVDHDRGTSWLVPQVVQKAKRWNATVAYDPSGPAGVFGDALNQEGVRTIAVAGRDLAHACSFFFDGVIDRTLRIRAHESLNVAIAAARRRTSGDAWVWARRDTVSDISPIVAVTIAAWAAQNRRKADFVF